MRLFGLLGKVVTIHWPTASDIGPGTGMLT
jgi:hypothetical protein